MARPQPTMDELLATRERDVESVEGTRGDATNDEAALADLYARCGPVAYGLAVGIVRDAAAAEEIVCAAFVETWAGMTGSQPSSGTARSRLLAAVHRRAAELVRSSYPRPEHRLPQADLLPDWLALERETAWGLLSQLPDPERDVIELAYFGCYTLAEIAGRLGLPAEIVSAHLSAGLGRLGELQGAAEAPVGGETTSSYAPVNLVLRAPQ